MYQYEVVPVMITRGAGESELGNQWATLRAGLNERGRLGFRVVAVSEGSEGRAIIMEREVDDDHTPRRAAAAPHSVSDAAEEITRESAGGRPAQAGADQ